MHVSARPELHMNRFPSRAGPARVAAQAGGLGEELHHERAGRRVGGRVCAGAHAPGPLGKRDVAEEHAPGGVGLLRGGRLRRQLQRGQLAARRACRSR